jgi:S1-C subfamily serine protease
LINNDGYIITNRYVIERSKSLKVTFIINGKKIEKEAKVVSWDKSTDLASFSFFNT